LPGRSNALAIAQRLGLDTNVIDAAKQDIDPNEMRADDLLDDIHRQRKFARKDRQKAQKARIEVHRLKRELTEQRENIEEERRKILDQAREQAEKQLEVAQAEIQALKRRLQEAEKPLEEIEDVEDEIRQLEEKIPQPLPQKKEKVSRKQESEISGKAEIGDTVQVRSLGTKGTVTTLGKKEIEVQVGALRMWAKRHDVHLVKKATKEETAPSPKIVAPPLAPPKMELDLRGERAEDALDLLTQYIDQAYLAEMPFVRIVHGKGTGRLREVVRNALRRNSQVKSFEEGQEKEGGSGVTVVKF